MFQRGNPAWAGAKAGSRMTKTNAESAPRGTRRSRPIVYYLVVLALVAFVPAMAFAAVLLERNNEAQQEIVQTLILATTDAVGQTVDRQIEGTITTLKGLSSAPMASEDDLRALHIRGTYALGGTGSFLVLAMRGSGIAASSVAIFALAAASAALNLICNAGSPFSLKNSTVLSAKSTPSLRDTASRPTRSISMSVAVLSLCAIMNAARV